MLQRFFSNSLHQFPSEMLDLMSRNTITNLNITYQPDNLGFLVDVEFEAQTTSEPVKFTSADVLNNLAKKSSERNMRKGFHDDDIFMENLAFQIPEINREKFLKIWTLNRKLARIALMHSELSEAVEAIRKNKMDDHLPHRKGEVVELADCIERIFDYSGREDNDLGGAHKEKTENINEHRPYKHGKEI